jgi:hypothetical protein
MLLDGRSRRDRSARPRCSRPASSSRSRPKRSTASARAPTTTRRREDLRGQGPAGDHPLIVHVAAPADARDFAARRAAVAQRLMRAFWPGPLTLILPRAAGIAPPQRVGRRRSGCAARATRWHEALLRAAHERGVPGGCRTERQSLRTHQPDAAPT